MFIDVDTIPLGVDFRDHIAETLRETDVVIAVIGTKWLGRRGKRARINDETDPVRIEIEATMRLGKLLIPVLVEKAEMPKPAELPESIARFAFINALTLDAGRDFHPHVDRLIRRIDDTTAANRSAVGGVRNAPPLTPAEEPRRDVVDVYLSYSYMDDVNVPGGVGWVTAFSDALQIRLRQIAGRNVNVWHHHQAEVPVQAFPEAVASAISGASVFVAIISPSYVHSPWCRRELEIFARHAEASGGINVGQASRIFKVLKLPVAEQPGDGIGNLEDTMGYQFFRRSQHGPVIEFDPAGQGRDEFVQAVNALAHDLSNLLSALR